jgi:uncharacterized protein YrrD
MSDVAANETRDLISSDKVAGTSVYDRNGNNLGTISNVMLEKRSGQVAYAVLSFGGFSEWDRVITLCRGTNWPTIRTRAAMSST